MFSETGHRDGDRKEKFPRLVQVGGLSGYTRVKSDYDSFIIRQHYSHRLTYLVKEFRICLYFSVMIVMGFFPRLVQISGLSDYTLSK